MNSLVTPTTLATAYAIAFAVCVLVGRAQRRELGASWARLLLCAVLLAAAATSPAVPALLLGEKLDKSWLGESRWLEDEEIAASGIAIADDWVRDGEHGGYWIPVRGEDEWFLGSGYSGLTAPVNVLVVLFALIMALRLVVTLLRPVWRNLGEPGELARVGDPRLLDFTRDLAARFGSRAPIVFRKRSHGDSLEINAQAAGILAPIVVATDGMLERIDDDETHAILAHELGHLVRRSSVRRVVIVHVVLVAGPVLSAFLFPSIALAGMVAAVWALVRLYSHADEKACDLIEARTVGFATAAKAMHRIHGQMAMDCGPVLERLFYATQTHPAKAVRLRHLAKHAPADRRDAVEYDAREAVLQRQTDWIVRGYLLVVFAFAMWAGVDSRLQWWGVGALVFTLLFPVTIVVLAVLQRLYYHWQLGYFGLPWRKPLWSVAFVACITVLGVGLGQPGFWPSWLALAAGIAVFLLRRKGRKFTAALELALRDQDFPRVLALCESRSRRAQRKPSLRTFLANVLAADRRDAEARAILDALAADKPGYWPAQLLRVTVTRWFDAAAALQIADQIVRRFPRNPVAIAHQAAMLLRVDRVDDAEARIRGAIRLAPAISDLYGLLSAVHRLRGDLDASDAQVAEFEARDPGSTLLLVYKARNLLARGDLAAAGDAIRAAKDAVDKNRMSLWMNDVDRLEAKHSAAGAAGGSKTSTSPTTRPPR